MSLKDLAEACAVARTAAATAHTRLLKASKCEVRMGLAYRSDLTPEEEEFVAAVQGDRDAKDELRRCTAEFHAVATPEAVLQLIRAAQSTNGM